MANLSELVSRLQRQITTRVPDLAEGVMRLPSAVYTSPDRFERERKALFRQRPLFVAWSAELPGPNTFRTVTVDGVEILLTRDGEGTLRAFRNSCRHRGMAVTAEKEGCAKRFTCPFHGWTFGNDGKLLAIAHKEFFPGVEKEDYGLTPIAVAEKYGFIVVRVEGDEAIDMDAHFAGLGEELGRHGFEKWSVGGRNELGVAVNWKLLMDGFCEGYHFNTIHPTTLGALVIPNTHVVDTFGPHVREVFANVGLREHMEQSPDRDLAFGPDMVLVYLLFPNLILIAQTDGGWHAITIWPDGAVDRTVVRQTIIVSDDLSAEAREECIARCNYIFQQVITAEDFVVSESIWSALKGGNLPDMLIGQNEAPIQHFHKTYNELAGEA